MIGMIGMGTDLVEACNGDDNDDRDSSACPWPQLGCRFLLKPTAGPLKFSRGPEVSRSLPRERLLNSEVLTFYGLALQTNSIALLLDNPCSSVALYPRPTRFHT